MSYFDERMIEIAEQRNPSPVVATVNTVLGDGTPGASPAGAIGAVLIAGGIIGTLATGGAAWPLGAFAVVAGLFALGGKQTVEHNIERMDTAAQESPEAVTEAAQVGLVKLIAYCVVGAVVLAGLFLFLAMAGEISGVTL